MITENVVDANMIKKEKIIKQVAQKNIILRIKNIIQRIIKIKN